MITSVVAMADGGVSTLLGLVHTIHGQGWRKLKIFTRHSCGEVFNFTLPAANFTLVWWLAGTFRSIFFTRQSDGQVLDFTHQRRIVPAFGGWQTSFAIPTYGHCHILRFYYF